jgi:drug/metabolite transporter (DMT)-like permease
MSRPLTPYLLLLLGVFAGSTAVVMIKTSTMPPAVLASYRLLLAAAILTPLFWRACRQRPDLAVRGLFVRSAPGAAFLGLHFVTWNIGARLTPATNATLVANMVPVVMPFITWLVMREVITRREVAGSLLSLAGVMVLSLGSMRFDGTSLRGDAICFVAMLMLAFYLIAARRNRAGAASLWLYIVPLYWIAGVACFAIALATPSARPLLAFSSNDYLLLLGLAAGPTVVGHTLLNHAMRHLRGQVVSIFNLGQFVFAGTLAFALLGEVPHPRFYLASALVVAGGVIVVMRSKPATEAMQKEAALLEE